VLWPAAALANPIVVPMSGGFWQASWVLLVPVVLVEGVVARRVLSLPLGRCFKIAVVANLVSTAIGIPLVLLTALLGAVIAIPIEPASIGPSGGGWVVAAASLALCVPCFFASVYVERWVARKMVAPELHPRIDSWSWRANLISYSGIVLMLIILIAVSLLRRH